MFNRDKWNMKDMGKNEWGFSFHFLNALHSVHTWLYTSTP